MQWSRVRTFGRLKFKMDREAAEEYLSRYREMNKITLEEARSMSVADRFRRFLEFRSWLESKGRLPSTDEDLPFYEKWSEMQRRYLERSRTV